MSMTIVVAQETIIAALMAVAEEIQRKRGKGVEEEIQKIPEGEESYRGETKKGSRGA